MLFRRLYDKMVLDRPAQPVRFSMTMNRFKKIILLTLLSIVIFLVIPILSICKGPPPPYGIVPPTYQNDCPSPDKFRYFILYEGDDYFIAASPSSLEIILYVLRVID